MVLQDHQSLRGFDRPLENPRLASSGRLNLTGKNASLASRLYLLCAKKSDLTGRRCAPGSEIPSSETNCAGCRHLNSPRASAVISARPIGLAVGVCFGINSPPRIEMALAGPHFVKQRHLCESEKRRSKSTSPHQMLPLSH